MTIGKNLKKIRKERNLRQKDVADKIGISRSFYSDIENDRKNVSSATLLKISEALNISINYLTTGVKVISDLTSEEFDELGKQVKKSYNNIKQEQISDVYDRLTIYLSNIEQQSFITNTLFSSVLNFIAFSNADEEVALSTFIMRSNLYKDIFNNDEISSEEKNDIREKYIKETLRFIDYRLGFIDELVIDEDLDGDIL